MKYMNGVLYMESGDRALVGTSKVQEEPQWGNVYMIKRHRNADMDRNKKQDLY